LDFGSNRFTLIRVNLPINNLNFGQDGSSINVLLLTEIKVCGEKHYCYAFHYLGLEKNYRGEERCIKRFLCFLRKQRESTAMHSARAAGYYIAIQVA
jgi:hypothetical protein